MSFNENKARLRRRLDAVKVVGKALLSLKSHGLVMTKLREARVSAGGWPDFLVSDKSGRIACLAVSAEAGPPDAAGQLFDPAALPCSLSSLAARLREIQQAWKEASGAISAAPALMIACPFWPEAELRRQWPALDMDDVLLAGKESAQPARLLSAWQRIPVHTAVTEEHLTLLRAFLAPETVIQPAPPSATERRRHRVEEQLSLLPQLLDYDQDRCVKLDLWLPEEGREAAGNFSLRLITGAAGTGKSVVLVHRAAMLRQFHPSARIAVLTHNRALCSDLEGRFQRICGSGGVEFLTFYSWLGRRWPGAGRVLKDYERDSFLPESRYDPRFLKDEFDWIHDQGLQRVEEYLRTPRTGRTKALRETQRSAIFQLLEEYSRRLDTAGVTDWSRRAFSMLHQGHRGLPYDFILVDEAQFFAPTWFKLIRSALLPGGHLFLCADPAQGFLGRGQSWREAGFEVKGRSIVLSRPYRNTLQILSFAAARYEACVRDDAEAPVLQIIENSTMRNGPQPVEIRVESRQEEIATVVRQVQQLVAGGAPPGDILMLCARRCQVEDVRHHLMRAGLEPANLDAPPNERSSRILLGTLDAATGLERPVVILCGLRDFRNLEQNPSLPEEERRRHRRLNASRLYMACTRAMERLVIVSCGEKGTD